MQRLVVNKKKNKTSELCCPCNNPDLDASEMIGCDLCNGWVHNVCVQIDSEIDTKDMYICPLRYEEYKSDNQDSDIDLPPRLASPFVTVIDENDSPSFSEPDVEGRRSMYFQLDIKIK